MSADECRYEGCRKWGCSQERLLGLEPCRYDKLVAARGIAAGLLLLVMRYNKLRNALDAAVAAALRSKDD